MCQGDPIELVIQHVDDARQIVRVDGSIRIRKQRAGMPVHAHTQDDQIEHRSFGGCGPGRRQMECLADSFLVKVGLSLEIVVLRRNPMDVLLGNRHLVEESIGGQLVVAQGRIGRYKPLVHPEQMDLFPW